MEASIIDKNRECEAQIAAGVPASMYGLVSSGHVNPAATTEAERQATTDAAEAARGG